MKRLCGILLALAGLFLYAPCAAQNTRVRGTVTDAQTGEPIPYAVVLFPGTTTGITTDKEVEILDGLHEGDEIVVSGTVSAEKSTPTNKNQRGPGPRL